MNKELIYVDVGARWGINERMSGGNKYNLNGWFDNIKSIGFEPDKDEFKKLKSKENEQYFPYALYSKNGKRDLYIMKSPDWSSFCKPIEENTSQFRGIAECNIISKICEVETKTLDSLTDDIDFIKIDTEGSEAEILKGADSLMTNKAIGAEIEIFFYPLREGQATFGEIHKFMLDRGFQLFTLTRNKYTRKGFNNVFLTEGQLIWGDAMYLKDYRKIENNNKLYKLYGLALSLGYYDYAYAMLDSLEDSEYIFKRD